MSRFFFAVWPNNQTRNTILQCRSQLDFRGRTVNQSNLHITLLFIGKMTVNQQKKIIQQANQIEFPSFEIVLDHSGYFDRSRAFWLGMQELPESLSKLHQELLDIARNCHLPIKPQSYVPHLTLARKAAPVTLQTIKPIVWSIDRFALLESIDTNQGVEYKIVKYFTCSNESN